MSKLELQLELERLYDKNQLMPRLREVFRNSDLDFINRFREIGIPEAFGLDLLAHMALRKRCNVSTLVGILRHHFDDSQLTANALTKAVEADLVDYDLRKQIFIVIYTISEEIQRDLDRFQYPLPMVIPPLEVKNNLDSGYIQSKRSIILKDNFHTDDVCLDHINRVNQMKFSINFDTASMIKNSWRNLDKPKEGETYEEYQQRKRAFEKYDQTAREVIDLLVQEGNEFYLTHSYDKRGRVYCNGYHVNYQGNPWNKAVIEFADKEPLNEI